jgi:hypothetical protein
MAPKALSLVSQPGQIMTMMSLFLPAHAFLVLGNLPALPVVGLAAVPVLDPPAAQGVQRTTTSS